MEDRPRDRDHQAGQSINSRVFVAHFLKFELNWRGVRRCYRIGNVLTNPERLLLGLPLQVYK